MSPLDVAADTAALAAADARMFDGNADYTPINVEDFHAEHLASDNPTAMRIYQQAGRTIRHETLVLEKPAV